MIVLLNRNARTKNALLQPIRVSYVHRENISASFHEVGTTSVLEIVAIDHKKD